MPTDATEKRLAEIREWEHTSGTLSERGSAYVKWLLAEVERLRAAIREHRDQRGDDRCWEDDARMYAVLGEPLPTDAGALPPKEVFLANCARFEQCRRSGAVWVPAVSGGPAQPDVVWAEKGLSRIHVASGTVWQHGHDGQYWWCDWNDDRTIAFSANVRRARHEQKWRWASFKTGGVSDSFCDTAPTDGAAMAAALSACGWKP